MAPLVTGRVAMSPRNFLAGKAHRTLAGVT